MAVPGDPPPRRDPARQQLTDATTPPELGAPADEAARTELRRVLGLLVDRVKAMPLIQLGRPPADGDVPRAVLVHRTSQALADLAADAEGRARRDVPVLALHGVGDQLAVLGADVLATADPERLARAHDEVLALRRRL